MKIWEISDIYNYGKLNQTKMNPTVSPPGAGHGVNLILGGAMISGIIIVIFISCYCCHKTHRKAQTQRPYWREPSTFNMEIYTVDAQNCYSLEELSEQMHDRSPTTAAPPAYDVVVIPIHTKSSWDKSEEVEPPSYEFAIKSQTQKK